MAIPVTFLSSYMYCPRRLFIERVLGIKPEIPKEALIKGSLRHKVYERINFSEEELVRSVTKKDYGFVLGIFREGYVKILKKTIAQSRNQLSLIGASPADILSELKPIIENEAKFRAERVFAFAVEKEVLGEELWESLTPKVKPEYRIESASLGLRGVIDELEVYASSFVPVELKTGKAPAEGVWPGHKAQAGAYAMMLEDVFGVNIKKAVVRYLDANETREIAVNPFLREEIKELISKVNAMLESGEIPELAANQNKCRSCDLKDICLDKCAIEEKLKSVFSNS